MLAGTVPPSCRAGTEHHSARSPCWWELFAVDGPKLRCTPQLRTVLCGVESSRDRGSVVGREGPASVQSWGFCSCTGLVVPIPPMISKPCPVSRFLCTRKMGRGTPGGRVCAETWGVEGVAPGSTAHHSRHPGTRSPKPQHLETKEEAAGSRFALELISPERS